MANILIITHKSDNDGHLSAAICRYFETMLYNNAATIIGWTHGDANINLTDINKYQKIYLLDLTLDLQTMNVLISSKKLIWIDHHKQSIDLVMKAFNNINIDGFRYWGFGACLLTWLYWLKQLPANIKAAIEYNNSAIYLDFRKHNIEYLIPNTLKELGDLSIYKSIPYWLYLLASFDSYFDKSRNKDLWYKQVVPFEYFIRSIMGSPDDMYSYVCKYLNNATTTTNFHNELSLGNFALSVHKKRWNSLLKVSYEKDIINEADKKLYKMLIINTSERGFDIFEYTVNNKNKYDYFILWNMFEGKDKNNNTIPIFKYSAYSEKASILVPGLTINGCVFNGHDHAGSCISNGKAIL